MLNVENIGCAFGSRQVLNNIGFSLEKGELCGLFGPNGSGKTTLFNCCLGLIRPNRGRVMLRGRDIRKMKIREMARFVAYVPQHHTPPFPFTALEMVLMGRTPHLGRFYRPGAGDRRAARDAMERLGIADLAHIPYTALSGGQKQLVLIARAMAQEADLIFLDEPTSALDFRNQVVLWKALRSIADQGTAILACSHDPNHVAWFCHTTVVLGNGRVLAKGDPARILSQDLMDRIYRDTCRVEEGRSLKIILPSGLTRDRPGAAVPENHFPQWTNPGPTECGGPGQLKEETNGNKCHQY